MEGKTLYELFNGGNKTMTLKTARQINRMIKEASAVGQNLYAKNLQINTLGMINDQWARVFFAKTLYGEPHVRTTTVKYAKVPRGTVDKQTAFGWKGWI